MIDKKRYAMIHIGWWLGLACVGGLGFGVWGLSKSECAVKGFAERSFTLDVDFNTFRQILVRTDATAAIVEHGGLKVIDESTDSVDIDLSNDSRPLRNLLKGKSKANVSATKHLTVQLNDPQLNASELKLSQDCKIQPDFIRPTSRRTENIPNKPGCSESERSNRNSFDFGHEGRCLYFKTLPSTSRGSRQTSCGKDTGGTGSRHSQPCF